MRKLSLVMMAVAMTVAANAQFGINAGFNIANIGGKDATESKLGGDKKALMVPHFGVYYNAMLGDHFSIQPEASFQPQGVKINSVNQTPTVTAKLALNYFDIGVIMRWNQGPGFYVGTGPQLQLLQSAKTKTAGQPDQDIKDQVKKSDFAWCFRAGYDLHMGLGFYAGFLMGFSTIDNTTNPDDIKNRVFQLGARFNITKIAKKGEKDKGKGK